MSLLAQATEGFKPAQTPSEIGWVIGIALVLYAADKLAGRRTVLCLLGIAAVVLALRVGVSGGIGAPQ